ncbi:MAG: hypothetical protein M1818_001941 [Claussenomyces sp. TS43310]|nr:MAG: hypothetical protein M1818_001941 [Claussenomyces sp. TS43310]
MAGMDNANPLIQNATDLPIRRRRKPEQTHEKDDSIYALWDAVSSHHTADEMDLSSSGSEADSVEQDEAKVDPIDAQEIYDLISTISDPEHPLSLGSLAVVNLPDIHLSPSPCLPTSATLNTVHVELTPTVTHCSLATVIGLGVRVRLEQALPPNFRVDVTIKEGTHSQDDQVNKQLADKERVAAALENATLMGVLRKMLETCV